MNTHRDKYFTSFYIFSVGIGRTGTIDVSLDQLKQVDV